MCASVLQNEFTDWMKAQIEERNEEIKEKGEMMIEMDPDVAAAFKSSTSVSRKWLFYILF